MILKSFKYSTTDWTLDGLTLDNANLIVGKNSSGKSRALYALRRVKSLLSQRNTENDKSDFKTELIFIDNENGKRRREIRLSLSISKEGKVISESLIVNDEVKIKRERHIGKINNEDVNPPEDMLLMHVRRDVDKYDFIEDIIGWSEETVIRSFIDQYHPSNDELYELVSKFTPKMRNHIVKMAKDVGFPLKDFGTFFDLFNSHGTISSKVDIESLKKVKFILIEEENVGFILLDDLSSGMYRTILLLILIEQLINLDRPALIAIDDLGEGLDYSRATKVGRLLFSICEEYDIQLIATSNEEFMMNIVDISNWNILVREGGMVKSITSEFCPEEFEDFKFSGLSNFDFFTSDFLNRMSSKLFNGDK